MARGKYLSLDEARKQSKLDQFAKEHPATGDSELFIGLLDAMAGKAGPARKKRRAMRPRKTRTSAEGT